MLIAFFTLVYLLPFRHFASSSFETNCYEIFKKGSKEDGIYEIYPNKKRIKVYCEMNKGGWTRLVNKIGKTKAFDTAYKEYLTGFGDPSENHWIGLKNMRNLVLNEEMQIRFDISNDEKDGYFIIYDKFFLDSESENYTMYYGDKVYGDLPNNLHNNGFSFSAKDWENDASPLNCAVENKSGWYNNCATNNVLSGKWCWREIALNCMEFRNFSKAMVMIRPKHK